MLQVPIHSSRLQLYDLERHANRIDEKYHERQPSQYLLIIDEGFFSSQQLIIAFDVLCLGMVLLLDFSVFKFYTKGNLIIMVTLHVMKWSLLFSGLCDGQHQFFSYQQTQVWRKKTRKNSKWYTQRKDNWTHFAGPKNAQVFCTLNSGSLLNYVECGKLLLWKQL